MNFEKTKTCSVREITDDFWTHKLRSFAIADTGRKQRSDLNHFFEQAKQLALADAHESVMAYALERVSSLLVRPENWGGFEAHLCHAGLTYPNTLQKVARILSTYHHIGYSINKNRVERFLNAVIQEHAPLGHHSEVAWALWMSKDLDCKLADLSIDLVSGMHSSVCALILLDLESSGKLDKPVKMTYWRQFENAPALREDLWLLSYEAGVRGWCGFGDAHIRADDHFELLRANGVNFYDVFARLTPIFRVRPNVVNGLNPEQILDLFDEKDTEDLLEFDENQGEYGGAAIDDFDVINDEF